MPNRMSSHHGKRGDLFLTHTEQPQAPSMIHAKMLIQLDKYGDKIKYVGGALKGKFVQRVNFNENKAKMFGQAG